MILGVVPRWRRNRMGRPLSPPQIHQKIIWVLSNFHKTTSEHWQRTSGSQKGSPFSSKGGRTKYKRQKEKLKLGKETHPGEGVVKKFPNSWKPSHRWVCGDITGRKHTHTHTNPQNMHLTETASREVVQTLTSTTSEQRLYSQVRAT